MKILLFNEMAKQLAAFLAFVALAVLGQMAAANNEVEKVFKDNEIISDVIPEAPKEFLKVLEGHVVLST